LVERQLRVELVRTRGPQQRLDLGEVPKDQLALVGSFPYGFVVRSSMRPSRTSAAR
jgi:hypothetical protein